VGGNVIFTITLTNGGPDTATNVTVADLLPSGLSFVSSTPSQGSYNSGTGVWTVGSVSSASSATLSITATVQTAGAKTNTAQVTASDQADADSTPNNNNATEDDQASATVTPQAADLSLTKGVNNASPNVGDNVTFTITLSNAGPNNATGVTVTDQLPSGLSFVSSTPSQGTYDNGTGVWTVGTVNSGGNATLQITATVTTSGAKTNVAEVTASGLPDPDSTVNNGNTSEDDYASVTVTPQAADLSLNKTVNNATPNVGDNVTFTITLTNGGPSTATGVQVTDLLPAGLSFVSSTASQGSYDNGTGVWTVGSVANGASPTLTITATVTTSGAKTNTAQVTASGVFDPDSTPNNNNAGEDDQASATVTPPSADLSVTKTDSPDPVAIGNDITYTITVTNAGPNTATNAVLSDTVPTNTTFRSITTPAGWTCGTQPAVGGTGAISCTNSSFAAGSSVFTLVVRVDASVTDGTIVSNTAAVSASTSDSNGANNSATQTTTVKQPLLVISQIYPGGGNAGATYTNDFIEIFNRGTTTVDFSVTNYSIQYTSQAGNFGGTTASVKTNITSGTIAPGQYFLIQGASGGANGVALPTPDVVGSIAMSATAGKVALVLGTAALPVDDCPGDDNLSPFNPNNAVIVDFVGYGATAATANHCYEGSGPAPFSTSTAGGLDPDARSTIRTSSCTDTNSNSADFSNPTTAPTARNTSTTLAPCP
jgi:uncharacterized repeat protein (TIGR01451 family)